MNWGLIICGCIHILSFNLAQATLGESVESIETDQNTLSAFQRKIVIHPTYSIHKIEFGSTTVLEYVSSSNIVFGLSWIGLVQPDLTRLLGSYHSEYQEASKVKPRQLGHRYTSVKSGRVVVEKWGHMRKLRGRAFVPSLIPLGVSLDEIK